MTYELKIKNMYDRRKHNKFTTNNRLEVVKKLKQAFSPKKAEELAQHGEFRWITTEIAIRVIKEA